MEDFNKNNSEETQKAIKNAKSSIEIASDLIKKHEFNEAMSLLNSSLVKANKFDLSELRKQLVKMRNEVMVAQKEYNDQILNEKDAILLEDISLKPDNQVEIETEEELFEEVQATPISEENNQLEDLETEGEGGDSKLIIEEEIEESIDFSDIKNMVKQLIDESLDLLHKGNIQVSLEKHQEIIQNLNNYI